MVGLKRILSLILATLVALSTSVVLSPSRALAASTLDYRFENTSISELDRAIELSSVIDKKISVAESKIASLDDETQRLKESIQAKLSAVSAERKAIKRLKSMFVHINRYASDSYGNSYAPGNCTWYVKQKRPDIGNHWGNANSWYYSAASQGWDVGNTPKKGAIATTTAGWAGHVAYVEGVSLDGEYVTISEMNVGGLYRMGYRTVHYTNFLYIYNLN